MACPWGQAMVCLLWFKFWSMRSSFDLGSYQNMIFVSKCSQSTSIAHLYGWAMGCLLWFKSWFMRSPLALGSYQNMIMFFPQCSQYTSHTLHVWMSYGESVVIHVLIYVLRIPCHELWGPIKTWSFFFQNDNNRHPIACPWGWAMRCLLWFKF